VLVAPGGRHLALRRTAAGSAVALNDDPPENFCRPAVDVMFRSVSTVYRDRVLAVVLTGMGRDGALGAKIVRDAGGEVFAQDEQTSVVWGMPGAVVAASQADRVLPLADVPRELAAALGRRNAAQGSGR
jgi:two-component system chemotaxis response regulator CheB